MRSIFLGTCLLLVPVIGGCVSTNSTIGDSLKGCEELSGDTISDNVQVDAKVKVFMQAAADFRAIGVKVKGDVKSACAHIATDLGAQDSWSALGDGDDAISNANGTGACDVANARVSAIVKVAAAANLTLVTVPGACHTDFQAQAACDAKCKAEATCDSGTVETRCTPGSLTVQCTEKCKAQSYCCGKVDVAANCMGKCEAECNGSCAGTCTAKDGTRTVGDANCRGKCDSSCNGTCKGLCKVEVTEGLSCGTNVKCKGECTTTHTDPVCETSFTPPTCKVDASCEESCTASVAAKATCDPPHVELYALASVNAEVPKLISTINANLPILISCAEVQGKLAVDVVKKLVVTGDAIVQSAGSLGGKSIACSAAGAKTVLAASASLNVSVSASANVASSCRGSAG